MTFNELFLYLYVFPGHVYKLCLSVMLNYSRHDVCGSVQVSSKDQWVVDVLSCQLWEFPDERAGIGSSGKLFWLRIESMS